MTQNSPTPIGIPDRNTCLRLLARAGVSDEVRGHVVFVAERALALALRLLARGHAVNVALVEAGALLHDVGRAFSHGPGHGRAGAAWLREQGVDEAVALIVERHILAGLTAAEAAEAGLPAEDLLPRTIEEKIVAHADNLTGRDGPRSLATLVAKLERRRSQKTVIERVIALDAEMRDLLQGRA